MLPETETVYRSLCISGHLQWQTALVRWMDGYIAGNGSHHKRQSRRAIHQQKKQQQRMSGMDLNCCIVVRN